MIRTKIFHVTAKGTMGLYEGKMVRQGRNSLRDRGMCPPHNFKWGNRPPHWGGPHMNNL